MAEPRDTIRDLLCDLLAAQATAIKRSKHLEPSVIDRYCDAVIEYLGKQVLEVVDGASVGDYGYGEEGSGWYPSDPERVKEQIREAMIELLQ